jgi:putative transposase
MDRWARASDEVRLPDAGSDIPALFLFEEKRKVHKDRTVSLRGVVYEVDAALVGETVILRFDPSRIGKPVEIWWKGRKVSMARQVDVHANCFAKRDNEVRSSPRMNEAKSDPRPSKLQGLRMRDFGVVPEDGENEGGR